MSAEDLLTLCKSPQLSAGPGTRHTPRTPVCAERTQAVRPPLPATCGHACMVHEGRFVQDLMAILRHVRRAVSIPITAALQHLTLICRDVPHGSNITHCCRDISHKCSSTDLKKPSWHTSRAGAPMLAPPASGRDTKRASPTSSKMPASSASRQARQ
jgi:hypothetical protein